MNWRGSVAPDLMAILRRSLFILTAVTVVTAWFSNTFYFPDEHYQILELKIATLNLLLQTLLYLI